MVARTAGPDRWTAVPMVARMPGLTEARTVARTPTVVPMAARTVVPMAARTVVPMAARTVVPAMAVPTEVPMVAPEGRSDRDG